MSDIFISHAAKNRKLAEKFSELILQLGIGVPAPSIYCTSTPGTIPNGDQFVRHIVSNLSQARLVIAVLSQDYVESHFCLEEAGAAQLLQVQGKAECLIFLVPPADYSSHLDGMLYGTQAQKLNDLSALVDLKPRVEARLGLTAPKGPAVHLAQCNAFLDVVKEAEEIAKLNKLKIIDVRYEDSRRTTSPAPPTYKLKLRVDLRNDTGCTLTMGKVGWLAKGARSAPAMNPAGYASGYDVGGTGSPTSTVSPGVAFNFWVGLHETSDIKHLRELHESKELGTATLPISISGYQADWSRNL